MQVSEISFENVSPIDSYGPGFFRVGGEVLRGPVLVTSNMARTWSGLADLAPLLALAGQIDVLVLGLGVEMVARPIDLVNALEAVGIGVELMTSPTACRAYNVLLAEQRRVALAAIPV